jgi:hypothetical protein
MGLDVSTVGDKYVIGMRDPSSLALATIYLRRCAIASYYGVFSLNYVTKSISIHAKRLTTVSVIRQLKVEVWTVTSRVEVASRRGCMSGVINGTKLLNPTGGSSSIKHRYSVDSCFCARNSSAE